MNLSAATPTWILVTAKILLLTGSAVFLVAAARAYYSEQQLVLAEGGRKTVKTYEGLLVASVKSNPWNANAQLRLADYYYSRKNYDRTLEVLNESSPGSHHWRGWERAGAAYERRAYDAFGSEEDVDRAAWNYDRVLRVNPSYQLGLERRAVLALKRGDWTSVAKLADGLQELDANNPNSVYMRARAAEALGHVDTASHLYTQLSARGITTTGSLFSQTEIRQRLEALGERAH